MLTTLGWVDIVGWPIHTLDDGESMAMKMERTVNKLINIAIRMNKGAKSHCVCPGERASPIRESGKVEPKELTTRGSMNDELDRFVVLKNMGVFVGTEVAHSGSIVGHYV